MRRHGHNACGEPYSSVYIDKPRDGYIDTTPSRTRQEFKDECDINILMAHYERNAVMPPQNGKTPQYFDASNVPDFRESLDIAREAQEAFMRVPAHVRKELDNDVYKFVEYAQDEKNIDQLRKWGLAEPLPEAPVPMKVEVVNSPPASAETAQK